MDWHPEDIKARIRKKGITLADIARKAGMGGGALRLALVLPRAEAERAIAAALDVHPMVIWPSRYLADGTRRSPQPGDNYRAAARFGKRRSSPAVAEADDRARAGRGGC